MKNVTETEIELHVCAAAWARKIVNATALGTKARLCRMVEAVNAGFPRFVSMVELHVLAQASAQATHGRN